MVGQIPSGMPEMSFSTPAGQSTDPSMVLFDTLYNSCSGSLERRLRASMHIDDAEDVLIDTWMRVWMALKKGTFEYRGDAQAKAWIFQIAQKATASHWRRELRWCRRHSFTLDEQVVHSDGSTDERYETIPQEPVDAMDQEQIELLMEVAEQYLPNDNYLELLRARLYGLPLPPEWDGPANQQRRDTAWHRIKKFLLDHFNHRR